MSTTGLPYITDTVTTTNTTSSPYVISSRGGPIGNTGPVHTVTAPGGVITDLDKINMADLTSEIFEAKVEDLLNLWVARFGNEWVDLDTLAEDQTFTRVYKRLRQTGQLEQHYLTDRARFVCRKPE